MTSTTLTSHSLLEHQTRYVRAVSVYICVYEQCIYLWAVYVRTVYVRTVCVYVHCVMPGSLRLRIVCVYRQCVCTDSVCTCSAHLLMRTKSHTIMHS